jgi:ribosomal protein S18 acetylase RimI-like enzyme
MAQFVAEAKETLAGKWGTWLAPASFCITQDGRMVSATVVALWKETPLLAYSVTDPGCQGKGMASLLIKQTVNALQGLGYAALDLGVTAGNASAEHLYRKLGFEVKKP